MKRRGGMKRFPPRVHRKRSKGRSYYYFNTGRKNAAGKIILAKLPDYASNGFGRAYAACMEAMENPTAADTELTIPAFCERYRKSPKFRKLATATQESYETYLRVIEDQMDTLLAEEVEPKDVLALMTKLCDRPGAANQVVRTLSALYAWGRKPEVGLVKHNPATGIELFEGGEHEPWPEWLLEKALRAEDQRVRLAAHLLYYTAARVGDVAQLRWTNVEGGRVAYVPEKTKRKKPEPLDFPIHQELSGILATVPRGVHTTIICKPDGTPYASDTISGWMMQFGADNEVEVVTHGLRKNAVNALLEAGCTVAQVQAISGQSLSVVEHYAKRRDKRRLGTSAIGIWERNGGGR